VLPTRDKAVGLAVGYSVSYVVGALIFTVKLRRRFVVTVRTYVIRTHVRLALAGVIAAIPTELIIRLIGRHHEASPAGALLAIIAAGVPGLVVFVLVARRLRIRELSQLLAMVPGR
jgi:putative peptidoglycan lipid II flippase